MKASLSQSSEELEDNSLVSGVSDLCVVLEWRLQTAVAWAHMELTMLLKTFRSLSGNCTSFLSTLVCFSDCDWPSQDCCPELAWAHMELTMPLGEKLAPIWRVPQVVWSSTSGFLFNLVSRSAKVCPQKNCKNTLGFLSHPFSTSRALEFGEKSRFLGRRFGSISGEESSGG